MGSDKDGNKLWLGGVGTTIIQQLKAGDIARELRRFGEVSMVEIKERCVVVTMESYADARDVLRESRQRSGRLRVAGEAFIIDEFRDSNRMMMAAAAKGIFKGKGKGKGKGKDPYGGGWNSGYDSYSGGWSGGWGGGGGGKNRYSLSRSPARSRTRARRSRTRSRDRTPPREKSDPRTGPGAGRITEEARELMEKVKESKQMSRDLDFYKVELRLSELAPRLQCKAVKTYLESDFGAVRRPMGWFTSIVNTLAMGLDHGSKPKDGGYKRDKNYGGGSSGGYCPSPRSDSDSPRTLARRNKSKRSASRQRSPSPRDKSRKRRQSRSISRGR